VVRNASRVRKAASASRRSAAARATQEGIAVEVAPVALRTSEFGTAVLNDAQRQGGDRIMRGTHRSRVPPS
jgi:hypothetical protein